MTGPGWAMMTFWSFVGIALLAAAVWFAVPWARGRSQEHKASPNAPKKKAYAVLADRLAGGDIDVEEYHKRRAALEQRERTTSP